MNALRGSRMLNIAVPVPCVVILLSLAVTVVFLVMVQLTRAIGGKGIISPELAAWLPSVPFGVGGTVMLRRTRS